MNVIGLMSGTSADGVDAALVSITGSPPHLQWRLLNHLTLPHPTSLRAEILACCRPETGTVDRICRLNTQLGESFAQAAMAVIEAAGIPVEQVQLIGCHGQTLWHNPQEGSTFQVGEAAVIAERTKIPVINNFRARDLAVGGQGAPLVSYVDALLWTHPTLSRTLLNIGGMANFTYLAAGSAVGEAARGSGLAFDIGPGNVWIDDAVMRLTQGQEGFDRDGQRAAQGRVDPDLLQDLLQDPYFLQPLPKTTGREWFGSERAASLWHQAQQRGLDPLDWIATLTALTATSIAQAHRRFLPVLPDQVIVSGGGTLNLTLMRMLQDQLPESRILTLDQLGLSACAKEALAFAVLAYESWHQRPGNLPAATGARAPVVLGQFTPGVGGGLAPILRSGSLASPAEASTGGSGSNPSPIQVTEGLPLTESPNPATQDIDALSTLDMVQRIHAEDCLIPNAITPELPTIAQAIEAIAQRMQGGGRLIYVGAGTSGRLGILDASECPPTFNTDPTQVMGRIAGGVRAITQAVEGAEDRPEAGQAEMAELNVTAQDAVVGIAASGSTPYVLGAMQAAKARGALVIALTCNPKTPMQALADLCIAPLVGPEVILGSTRMKAGTAQKLVLNMLSTGVMIRLGKTFGNLMVDLQATNTKLKRRAERMVQLACQLDPSQASTLLEASQGSVKVAIVATQLSISPQAAAQRLQAVGGHVRQALK